MITEDLLDLVPMNGTTTDSDFMSIVEHLFVKYDFLFYQNAKKMALTLKNRCSLICFFIAPKSSSKKKNSSSHLQKLWAPLVWTMKFEKYPLV